MRYFLGPLAEMHVLEGKRIQGLPVEETVSLFVRSVGGVIGTIDLSWSITKQRSSYLDIYGSNGAVAIGWKDSRHLDYSRGEWSVFGSGYNRVQAFRNQIINFIQAILGEKSLLISEDEALASVNVVGTAYRALRDNQWTPVANHQSGYEMEKEQLRNWAAV
jgi:predicted dehydrogenase